MFFKITSYSAVILFIFTFRSIDAEDRIVNGSDADIKNWGYQVLLLDDFGPLCGGALIRDNWICTAAHCTDFTELSAYKVRLGSNFATEGGLLITEVEKVIVHPDYQKKTTYDNDIALFKLKSKITAEQKIEFGITTIALCEHWPQPGVFVWVLGYGTLYYNGPDSKQLQKVQVKTIDRSICQNDYGQQETITPSMQCAGLLNGGKDSCQGDSGGPLVHNGRLCGVVSWGYFCASPKYPGVYTSVPFWRKWIIYHVNWS